MASAWMTYAWRDNEDQSVDFVVQELEDIGLTVKLDRWNIGTGRRLWEQIEQHIVDPEIDAWLFVVTQTSLKSEPCREEFAIALDRALSSRDQFPIIALLLGPVDKDLLPPTLRVRLYVSILDPDWKERVLAAAERRELSIARPRTDPFVCRVHSGEAGKVYNYVIEMRPRSGSWSPFGWAIRSEELETVAPQMIAGPKNNPRIGSWQQIGTWSADLEHPEYGTLSAIGADNAANHETSYYLKCVHLPSILMFGQLFSEPREVHVVLPKL